MLISYTVLPHALLDQKLSVRLFVSLNDDISIFISLFSESHQSFDKVDNSRNKGNTKNNI